MPKVQTSWFVGQNATLTMSDGTWFTIRLISVTSLRRMLSFEGVIDSIHSPQNLTEYNGFSVDTAVRGSVDFSAQHRGMVSRYVGGKISTVVTGQEVS